MHGHVERHVPVMRQSGLAYVSIFASATSYLYRQQREAVVSSRDLRPNDRARPPPQRPVAPIRRRRMVQPIERRGARRRPVVPPETLLRPAKATACTPRRTSLTSNHADENSHYDHARTPPFRTAPRTQTAGTADRGRCINRIIDMHRECELFAHRYVGVGQFTMPHDSHTVRH
jgi:hypothetical protein